MKRIKVKEKLEEDLEVEKHLLEYKENQAQKRKKDLDLQKEQQRK